MRRRNDRRCLAALAAAALSAAQANAAEIDTGNPDVKLRWDNSIKYSNAFRLKKPSTKLTADPTLDDGDRNFGRGLISNRLDLLSEMDVSYQGFGARVSAAAWYDTVYNRSNDNDAPFTANSTSVPYNEFTAPTRKVHGRKAELLDAFIFGGVDLGDSKATFRLGRHTVLWGESLFFGANGIAGGQAPIDVIKALSVPGTQFKELIRPVPQVSGQLQLGTRLSIGAYYQFRWEKTRLPAAGSYFSTLDYLGDGGETLVPPALAAVAGQGPFYRMADIGAKDSGQGGVQLRWRWGETDLGFYATRFHSKTPGAIYGRFIPPDNGFQWVYPEGIRAYGASASHTFGEFNLAGEVSVRRNTPFASDLQVAPSGIGDNAGKPLYAVGNSVHAQVSVLATLGPTFIAQESTLVGELAWNRRERITKNPAALNPNADRDATNLRVSFEPLYRQVLPGLDLGVPMGLGVGFGNSSVVAAFNGHHTGDLSIGLNGTYLAVWRLGLNLTHFFGPEGAAVLPDANGVGHSSFRQSLKDRDFLSLSVQRSF